MSNFTVSSNIDTFMRSADYDAAVALLGLTPEYGSIYVADNVTAQSIAAGATPTKLTSFTTDGLDTGTIANAASNQLDLTLGIWEINVVISFSGDANVEYDGSIYLDEVLQPSGQFGRKLSAGGDLGTTCCTCLLSATAGQAVSVRMRSDDAGAVDMVALDMTLTAKKLA
jgi:hypothetical protein